MIEEYAYLTANGYKIMEIYNPVTSEKTIMLFTEYFVSVKSNIDPADCLTVEGIDISDFLLREKLHSRDNIVNFQTNFTAFMQKSRAIRNRFSTHFPYRVLS